MKILKPTEENKHIIILLIISMVLISITIISTLSIGLMLDNIREILIAPKSIDIQTVYNGEGHSFSANSSNSSDLFTINSENGLAQTRGCSETGCSNFAITEESTNSFNDTTEYYETSHGHSSSYDYGSSYSTGEIKSILKEYPKAENIPYYFNSAPNILNMPYDLNNVPEYIFLR